MSLPVRCFTCDTVIGHHELKLLELSSNGVSMEEILKILNVSSDCCRRMILGHVDVVDKLLLYAHHKDNELESKTMEKN